VRDILQMQLRVQKVCVGSALDQGPSALDHPQKSLFGAQAAWRSELVDAIGRPHQHILFINSALPLSHPQLRNLGTQNLQKTFFICPD
jgi:hypothetical protein